MSSYPPPPPILPEGQTPPVPPPAPLPYQSPQLNYGTANLGLPCPRCACPYSAPVRFTWWGGVIGPKILSHVKCKQCGCGFNSKTGRSNTTGIVIYTVVVLGIVVLIAALRFMH